MDARTEWFNEAAAWARHALCLRARCGAILVNKGVIIGAGYNGPPNDNLDLRVCGSIEPSKKKPRSDRTCCLHAEWRALLDACIENSDAVHGSTLVFCRVDANGQLLKSGKPYCTVCSRLALDREVDSWLLWHEDGIREYSALDYHRLSERYDELTE